MSEIKDLLRLIIADNKRFVAQLQKQNGITDMLQNQIADQKCHIDKLGIPIQEPSTATVQPDPAENLVKEAKKVNIIKSVHFDYIGF